MDKSTSDQLKPANPYPYQASKPFPYGRDNKYLEPNFRAAQKYGLGDLRQSIHVGGAEANIKFNEAVKSLSPEKQAAVGRRGSQLMQSMLGGSAPKWSWIDRGNSVYSGDNQQVSMLPSDYADAGFALPLHEGIHALQSSRADSPAMVMSRERYGDDNYRVTRELAPTIGAATAQAQASLPYLNASDIRWEMGSTYDPSLEYLRSQAEKYGVFNGQSIDKLISENPQFLQLLARQDATSTASPAIQPQVAAIQRSGSQSSLQDLASNTMDINRPQPQVNRTQTMAPVRQYGLGQPLPREQSPVPSPTISRPAPLATTTPQQPALTASAAGVSRSPQRPVVPWVNDPVYKNVPRQELARTTERYDPESYYQATTTDEQRAKDTAIRSEGMLSAIQQDPSRGGARYGARSQYQVSPVTGYGLAGLNAADQQAEAMREQQRAADVAAFRQQGLARDARIAADPTAQARFAAMNGGGAINPAQYRGQLGQATAQYQTYSRAARLGGQNPVSFDTFLNHYGGQMSPEIRDTLEAGRNANRMAMGQRGGPNLQASQFLNARYGVPMAMPANPTRAQQWQDSLAMQGNPYAMTSNLAAQQQQAAAQQAAMQQATQMQQTLATQMGLNYREGLAHQAPPLSPMERQKMLAGAMSSHPVTVGNEFAKRKRDEMVQKGYTPEQIRAAEPEIQAAYSQGYAMALPQYQAGVQSMPEFYPAIGSQQPYGLPAQAGQVGAVPPPTGQTLTNAPGTPPGYVSMAPPVSSIPDPSKPDALDLRTATAEQVARLAQQNPMMSNEAMDATLAAEGLRMPQNPLALYDPSRVTSQWFPDLKDPAIRQRVDAARQYASQNAQKLGIPSAEKVRTPEEMVKLRTIGNLFGNKTGDRTWPEYIWSWF